MTEITPLLKQECDVPSYNAASKTEGEEEDLSVYEAESEIPFLEIVSALFSEWQRNGANEVLTPQDIMAMHLQYRRITGGREVFHAQHLIMNELADAMFRWTRRVEFSVRDPHAIGKRHILRNLRYNWSSIINFDENLSRNLNVYHPPTYQERTRNAWMNCIRKYTALQSFFSHFIFQLVLVVTLLGWPLSLLIMGVKFMSQCPMNSFLPIAMVAVGVVGISALLSRLLFASIEKWCWFPMRTVISSLWNALQFVECVYLLALIIQLWFFFEDSPSFDSKDPNFCNETFYSFMFWMKSISTAFAVVWLAVYFVKAVFWVMKIRYHYMPLFEGM